MKSAWSWRAAAASPLAADDVVENALAGLFNGFFPSMTVPVFTSVLSGMLGGGDRVAGTLMTGAMGLPVGVPKPVVKSTTVAPEPTSAVVDSTSLPGVQSRFSLAWLPAQGSPARHYRRRATLATRRFPPISWRRNQAVADVARRGS
jgi:hypothetical protein